MSLTELFLGPPEEEDGDFSTEVISPDFLSTPTIDQGRGLGKGLGLPAAREDGLPESSLLLLASSFVGEENLADLKPKMEPEEAVGVDLSVTERLLLLSSKLSDFDGTNSLDGDVNDPARPVDLISVKR